MKGRPPSTRSVPRDGHTILLSARPERSQIGPPYFAYISSSCILLETSAESFCSAMYTSLRCRIISACLNAYGVIAHSSRALLVNELSSRERRTPLAHTVHCITIFSTVGYEFLIRPGAGTKRLSYRVVFSPQGSEGLQTIRMS